MTSVGPLSPLFYGVTGLPNGEQAGTGAIPTGSLGPRVGGDWEKRAFSIKLPTFPIEEVRQC